MSQQWHKVFNDYLEIKIQLSNSKAGSDHEVPKKIYRQKHTGNNLPLLGLIILLVLVTSVGAYWFFRNSSDHESLSTGQQTKAHQPNQKIIRKAKKILDRYYENKVFIRIDYQRHLIYLPSRDKYNQLDQRRRELLSEAVAALGSELHDWPDSAHRIVDRSSGAIVGRYSASGELRAG